MIIQIFCIEDVKANLYNLPFFMRSVGEALRAFADLANDKSSKINQHPEDYRLVRLGTYNDEDGSFVSHKPESMGRADEFIDVKVVAKEPIPLTLKAMEN